MKYRNQKEQNFDKLPTGAAEFIRLIVKKMRYTRKARLDVQAELTAHFDDELRDCTTDEEKEKKTRQLIAEFGNVKLLAILLRRAKKRCRPLWRTAFARTCQAVVLVFVCFIIYVVWFLSGKPSVTTNYVARLNRLITPTADETFNAAASYHKAAEQYEELPEEILNSLRKKHDKAASDEKKIIEEFIANNGELLDMVVAGTNKPYYWRKFDENSEMISILLPYLSAFRQFAYTLCWRAQLHAEKGRYEEAFDDIKSCYRLGRHLRGDRILIDQLVGIAIEALAADNMRDILSEYQIDSAALAKLQQDFEKMIPDEDFVVSLKAEKLFMYDEIQRCFTEDRFGGGHLYLRRIAELGSDNYLPEYDVMVVDLLFSMKKWPVVAQGLFTHPNKQQTKDAVDRFFAFWESIARKSPARIRAGQIDIEEETDKIIKGNIFLQMLAPAIGRVFQQAYAVKVNTEASLTIAAILRYGRDKSTFPDTLEELITADYIKKLPIDPYSDNPLIYRKTDDGFTLYSIGGNFKDDGGKAFFDKKGRHILPSSGRDADMVFWPMPKSHPKQ